jgi:hypothetical protein
MEKKICDHGLIFDKEKAKGLSKEEVRKLFPRLDGDCPNECGFSGTGYVSYSHFLALDYETKTDADSE